MPLGDGIRSNVAHVSQEERNRLLDAIVALQNKAYGGQRSDNPVGGVTFWFKQDEIHQATHVHGGPAFLTWHRELVNRFEALVREVDPDLSLHYWDWETDPRHSSNGAGGFIDLFTADFMGSGSGSAGEPWLGGKLYDPTADPFRGDSAFDPAHGNPFDPPRTLSRAVTPGPPNLAPSDPTIIGAPDFPTMRGMLESAHNTAHGYIGGTIGDPHTSFRDPFVYLLHSNVDRLFAGWQRQPGQSSRLDPAQVYGSEGNTVATGTPPFVQVGILTPLEPWAGVFAPGAEPGVRPTRPWAPPENQTVFKTSKDPSVVAPLRYDTSPTEELQLVGLTDVGGIWHTIRHGDGSWQSFFGDVKGQESNDPGHLSAAACAGVYGEMHAVVLTDGGGIWHTIRRLNGSWQPFFADVKQQESNDPGHFSSVGAAGVNGELQLVGIIDDGGMWHTIRHPNGSWQPLFGNVKGQESNNPGHFTRVSCGAVGGSTSGGQELHLVGLTADGRMWHTIRRADGSWQPFFGDVKGQESNDPGFFSAVGCAGVGGDLHVVSLTDDGWMWHTIRRANGKWQPFFGDVKGQESNDPGFFSSVSCGSVNGDIHVVGLTNDGRMWHTIRHPTGSWQPFFGDVKGQESNDPGHFAAVGSGGVG